MAANVSQHNPPERTNKMYTNYNMKSTVLEIEIYYLTYANYMNDKKIN